MRDLSKNRLHFEKAIMASQLPHFQLRYCNGEWFFMGWQKGLQEASEYQLKLTIPEYYPDQMPKLYITSPVILPKYKNVGTINAEGYSHDFHTCSNSPDGCVQICHFKPEVWDASRTCVGILIKGILWILAYEFHLLNGKSINANLNEIKRRQENAN